MDTRRPLTLRDLRRGAARGLVECTVAPATATNRHGLWSQKVPVGGDLLKVSFMPAYRRPCSRGTELPGVTKVLDYRSDSQAVYVHADKLKGVDKWVLVDKESCYDEHYVDPARMLDRLIQIFGPDAEVNGLGHEDFREALRQFRKNCEEKEKSRRMKKRWEHIERQYAPKNTDEVAPSSGGDGDLHGGDNASQEVPDGEAEGGDTAGDDSDSGDVSAPSEGRESSGGGNDRTPSGSSKYTGRVLDESSLQAVRKRLTGDPLVNDVYKRIREFVELARTPSGTQASPRVDARKLVKEMASKSYRAARWKRAEIDHGGHIVIAVDCSGSCSSYSADMMAMGIELCTRYDNVITLDHVNGVIREPLGEGTSIHKGRRVIRLPQDPPPVHAGKNSRGGLIYKHCVPWIQLLAHFRTKVLLWIGDTDGRSVRMAIKEMSPETRIVFLDSGGDRSVKTPCLQERSPEADVWVTNVTGLRTMVPGLELAMKAWRKL